MRVAVMTLALAGPAVNAAWGAGPVVGWGAGAAIPNIAASAIAVGRNPCAIQAGSGAVVYWGDNREAQATPPPSVDGSYGVVDGADNCPYYAASNRIDTDHDGRGDACECTDQTGDSHNTVSDLVAINRASFTPGLVTPLCDGNNDGRCNVSDIIAADVEIFSPGNTSTCARQAVPGP